MEAKRLNIIEKILREKGFFKDIPDLIEETVEEIFEDPPPTTPNESEKKSFHSKMIRKSKKEGWGISSDDDLIIQNRQEWLEIREMRRTSKEEEKRKLEELEKRAMKRHGTLRKKRL